MFNGNLLIGKPLNNDTRRINDSSFLIFFIYFFLALVLIIIFILHSFPLSFFFPFKMFFYLKTINKYR